MDPFLEELNQYFVDNYIVILKIFVVVIFTVTIDKILTRSLVKIILEHSIKSDVYATASDREKRINTLSQALNSMVRLGVTLTGAVIILNLLGIGVTPILASAGVLGVVLGFGTQKLITDMISGIFIVIENQYRVGDYVELSGVSGTVEAITLRTTVLRDFNGYIYNVPNGSIVVSTNRSLGAGQIYLDINLDPGTSIEKVKKIINQVGQDIAENKKFQDMIIEQPKYSRVVDVTSTALTVKVIGKTKPDYLVDIKSAFLSRLKSALEQNNIELGSALAHLTGIPPKK